MTFVELRRSPGLISLQKTLRPIKWRVIFTHLFDTLEKERQCLILSS
jgi:hypothetical protein